MSIKPPISGFNREHQADRRDMFPAALLSVAVHGALFVGLFTAFQWNTSEEAVYAELWAPEEISGGNDPSGVAEKLPEVKSKDTEEQQEEKAAAPEPNPPAEPPPAAQPEPAQPTPEDIAREKAQEAQRIEEEQIARAAQEELEARRQEAERIAQERARAEEIERMRQEAIEAEQRRLAEEARREEEERIAQERLAEQAKRAEEERQAEEARRQEAARLAEEARKAEEAKKAEEERLAAEAEAKRIAEELKREEAERQAQEAAQKAAAERQAREAEQAKRRIAQQARERELARLAAKIDPNAQRSGTTRGDQRNFRRSLTGSALATWSNRVRACIRRHILFDVPVNTPRGRYVAEYQVRLQSDGKQIGSPELKKSSGLSAYDTNVLRAIRLCNPFPQPTGGEAIPSVLTITFDPVDDTAGK